MDQPWQDLPQDGQAVWHHVRRQKYVCRNPECSQHDFVERLPGFTEKNARKTLRFQRHCVARALASGCKPAEDALKAERASVSNDTIARYVKVAALARGSFSPNEIAQNLPDGNGGAHLF